MPVCNKQHISNICSSIHVKAKQHWGWAEKKCYLQKSAYIPRIKKYGRKWRTLQKNSIYKKKFCFGKDNYFKITKFKEANKYPN